MQRPPLCHASPLADLQLRQTTPTEPPQVPAPRAALSVRDTLIDCAGAIADLVQHYKPDREMYLSAPFYLDLKPEEVMMCAAHVGICERRAAVVCVQGSSTGRTSTVVVRSACRIKRNPVILMWSL